MLNTEFLFELCEKHCGLYMKLFTTKTRMHNEIAKNFVKHSAMDTKESTYQTIKKMLSLEHYQCVSFSYRSIGGHRNSD
jgi:hypothetical protein